MYNQYGDNEGTKYSIVIPTGRFSPLLLPSSGVGVADGVDVADSLLPSSGIAVADSAGLTAVQTERQMMRCKNIITQCL